MMRRYELIVFDLDGTLMDSAAKILGCLAAAATDVGIVHPGEEAARNIIGLGMEEALVALFPDISSWQRTRLLMRFREHYLHLDPTEIACFPGVPQGLQQLVQDGHQLAIATGRPRRGLERVLLQTGLRSLFVASRCADEVHSKPHPRMLQEILAETNANAEQTVMVGDTVYDMQMARSAGVDALAVSYGVHQAERLLQEGALACVDSFPEVCAWLS
jgi:phosphoglycolate phosphatase